MEIRTLENITHAEILDVFNESFSDYIVPFHLSLEGLENMMRCESVVLDISVGAFENDKLIGFVLRGFDVVNGIKTVYNGGTGVVPSKRGNGITQQLYKFIVPILHKKGIQHEILEVIIGNERALHIYQKTGFNTTRKLNCYKGYIQLSDVLNTVLIKNLDGYDWKLLQSFWDFEPAWSNSITSLKKVKNSTISLGAYDNNILVGYLVYNQVSKRVQQFGVDKAHRKKGIGKQLFNHIIQQVRDNNISIINVESTSTATAEFLNRIGLNLYIQQYEMMLDINQHRNIIT